MKQQDKPNSRRSFLKKAVIGSLATATSGTVLAGTLAAEEKGPAKSTAAHSWETPPPPIHESQIKHKIEADIVVIGAGMSGLATAHAAAEAGQKVVLLEKMKTFSARGYANGALDTKLHKKAGITQDKEYIIAQLILWANDRINQKLIRTWADKSGEVLDYYIDLAVANGIDATLDPKYFEASPVFREFQTAIKFRDPKQTYHGYTFEPTLAALIESEAKKHGVDIHYKTRAEQLVKDAKSGRIVAVIAKQDGEYVKVTAKKGIVLCTGDYGSNPEMVEAWAPILKKVESNLYTPVGANVGDGINMAMWQGAEIQGLSHPTMIHCVPGSICDRMASNFTFLRVNIEGERYENEVQTPQGMCDGRLMQPGNKAWAILDSKYLQDHSTLRKAPLGPQAEPLEQLEASVKNKLAFKADTIEGLAEQIGVPAAALAKTVARYTEHARSGKDEDYGKTPEFMFTIEKSPFYALPIFISQLVVVGGLDVNGDCEVMDKNAKVMPGLYAIGNVAGNFFANDYPFTVPGLSHGRCLTLGRVLGQKLAKA